jgi:hypothetical protein
VEIEELEQAELRSGQAAERCGPRETACRKAAGALGGARKKTAVSSQRRSRR